ncbi:hypothetical protein WA026_005534 [Henosepilachna vigintioctopunctata]
MSNCSSIHFDRQRIENCDAHVFKNDENYIGREYSLLCEDQLWKLSLVGTLNTAGSFFGLSVTGIISDRFGRKIVLLYGMILCGLTGLIKSLSPTFIWFSCFEFLEGFFAAGSFVSACVLVMELVKSGNRIRITSIIFTCYAMGEVLLGVVSWAVRDWRWILYIIYGPCLLLFSFYWAIPESMRWYLSKGELEKPKEILKKIARSNGKLIPETHFDKLKLTNEKEQINFIHIVKSISLCSRLVNCIFLWVACAILFYGLSLNSVTLAGDSYMDFILISLAEVPGYWISSLLADNVGRRSSLAASYAITFAACMGFIFLRGTWKWIEMLFYCIGKFGATLAFILIYAVTSELFPTPLRNTAMSLCSMIARLGTLISPQTTLLGLIWKPLPLVFFASIAATACFLSLFLPETLNTKLPDTIEEAENIRRKNFPSIEDSKR